MKVLLPGILCLLLAACSGDDSPVAPSGDDGNGNPDPAITQYEVSVKMSSIFAVDDCENTPGNPGEFRYTLRITRKDEFDNTVIIGTSSPEEMVIGDGSSLGSNMEPIRFMMPNEPGAVFEVEYWVGEYDPEPDFEVHGWQYHVLDRNDEQLWAAGTRAFHSYKNDDPENSYGILKFAVWDTRAECSGYANYIVTWKPIYDTDGS